MTAADSSPPAKAGAGQLSITLVFDGGSVGNPGPAYGSYLIESPAWPKSGPQRERFGRGTNNQAEYKALLAGLKEIHRRLRSEGTPPAQVVLRVLGDSKLVISQVSGQWKVKQEHLRRLRDEAQRLLRPFGQVRLEHHDRRKSVRLLGH